MQSDFWEKLTLESSKTKQTEEFVKKYRGSYVFIKNPSSSKEHLVLFEGYQSEDRKYHFSENGVSYLINHDTDVVISASFPTPKLVNWKDRFYFFSRVPARQYRKAPTDENCSAISLLDKLIALKFSHFGIVSSFNRDVLYNAFFPVYIPLPNAIQSISAGKAIGIAVSERFAVSLHPSDDVKLLLWLDTAPVAEIFDREIEVKAPVFKQEVLDFVSRNNYNFYVK